MPPRSQGTGRAARRIAVVVLAALVLGLASLARWGNAIEEIGMYLPFIRSLAGTWPGPPAREVELLARLPLGWCRVAAFFEERGVLLDALFVAVVVARFALAASAVALASTVARGPGRVFGAALVVLAIPALTSPAGFRLLQAEALPAAFAIPLALAALAAALRGSPLLAGVLLGSAAWLHPVQAFATSPTVAVAVALARGGRNRRASVATFALACAVTALPVAWQVLARRPSASPPLADVYALLEQTAAGHVFLGQLPPGDRGALFLWSSLLLLGVARGTPLSRRLAAGGVAGLGVALVGLALAQAHLLPLVGLQLHLGRAAVPAVAVALVLAGRRLSRRAPLAERLGWACVAAGVLEGPLVAAAGALVVAASRARSGRERLPALLAGACALLAGLELVADGVPRDVSAGATCVVAIAFAIATRLRRSPGLALAIALGGALVGHHVALSDRGAVLSWARLERSPIPDGAARRELGGAIAAVSSSGDVVLVPPEERILPYLSGRDAVALAHRATLAIWDVPWGRDEVRRLEKIGYRFGSPDRERAYHAWPPERIRRVARELGAAWIVVDRRLGEPDLGPPRFENARFRLHSVRTSDGGD